MPEEERRISPAVIIIPVGLGLGLAAAVFAALAWAAPPAPPEGEIYCPYCGTGPFATLDDLNNHITEVHPGEPLIIHIEWE